MGSVSFVGNVNRRCNVGAVLRASGVEGAVRLAMVMKAIDESYGDGSPLAGCRAHP